MKRHSEKPSNEGSDNDEETPTIGDDNSGEIKKRKLSKGIFKLLLKDEKILFQLFKFFTNEEILQTLQYLNKYFNKISYLNIFNFVVDNENYHFDELDDGMNTLIDVIKKFTNLKSLTIDGIDTFDDEIFSKLLRNLPSELKEIHIRECGISSPKIIDIINDDLNQISNMQILKVLRFSFCELDKLEIGNLKNLQNLEFYDCQFENAPKVFNCKQLEKIILFKCSKLTDLKLLNLLKTFIDEELINKKESSEEEEEDGAKPAKNDDDSIFDVYSKDERVKGNLKKLFITECEPLTNPVIQSNTLEEIKLIDCRYLNKPFISCPELHTLQLNWCENLQNLTLACDNLKSIDLTGAGVNFSHSQNSEPGNYQENPILKVVVEELRKHYGSELTITM
ncbi:hypothetical protein ABK040_005834 [Willaertia magna]